MSYATHTMTAYGSVMVPLAGTGVRPGLDGKFYPTGESNPPFVVTRDTPGEWEWMPGPAMVLVGAIKTPAGR